MRLTAALPMLVLMLVPPLAACGPAAEAPGPPTAGEESAVADAEAMLAERPAPDEAKAD